MTLTRRIEIYIKEADLELRREYLKAIYSWRYLAMSGANELLSYLYSIDRLKYYKFITDNTKLELGIIGVRGNIVKENSASYVLLSERMKGKIPADILSCLQKNVIRRYQETRPSLFKGSSCLYTYKNNIPLPFSANSIKHIGKDDNGHYYFTLFGIRFGVTLGRDRSNNQKILEECNIGLCTIKESSLLIDDKSRKIFLLLSYQPPFQRVALDDNLSVNASLSIEIPIVASFKGVVKMIGNKEEFLYRRLQIQSAIRRAQINSKYTEGGRGRKRKLSVLGRYHKKEKYYIDTKIHTYSKLLIDFALENNCSTINLINQAEEERKAKGNSFLLRNWSYYGLRKKLEYKAALYGIKVTTDPTIRCRI